VHPNWVFCTLRRVKCRWCLLAPLLNIAWDFTCENLLSDEAALATKIVKLRHCHKYSSLSYFWKLPICQLKSLVSITGPKYTNGNTLVNKLNVIVKLGIK
jgi:hypothetical protein